MPRLLIINGPNVGVSYQLGDRTRIGRLGENEIQVQNPNVSRIHAEIINERDVYQIYDRGSKNGIVINGEEVPSRKLEPGDEITIGGSTFVFDGKLDIHNARFSDNSIYLLPGDGKEANPIDDATGADNIDPNTFSHITDIFGGPAQSLPVLAERICGSLREYFNADHAVLFLKDNPDSELRPFEAAPHGEGVVVDAGLLHRAEKDKRAMSLTKTINMPAGIDNNDDEETSASLKTVTPMVHKTVDGHKQSAGNASISMMCAPLLSDDSHVSGMFLITRHDAEPLTSENLSALQKMATFAAMAVQAAIAIDIPTRSPAEDTPLNPEQRSASTHSLRMQEIYNSARRSADGTGTVLITGETGTGKETLARFIHEIGPRANGPFTVVNCAAIPPDHFESELFGYAKNAANDAGHTIPGKVEQAMGGTLFLDEVGNLDLSLQPKLLRFLQDKAFYRVGSTRAIQADVKIIAATTVDLAAAVRAGKFREDLWYRLNVVPFHMPPLRERREDIGPLVEFFIARHTARLNSNVLGANDNAISLLQKHDWPGNIRELNNAVERAVLLADSKVLSTGDFAHIEDARRRLNSHADLERKRDTKPLAEVERQHIIIALKKHNFNQARASEALGLHRNTLRNKIIEYGIEIPK